MGTQKMILRTQLVWKYKVGKVDEEKEAVTFIPPFLDFPTLFSIS